MASQRQLRHGRPDTARELRDRPKLHQILQKSRKPIAAVGTSGQTRCLHRKALSLLSKQSSCHIPLNFRKVSQSISEKPQSNNAFYVYIVKDIKQSLGLDRNVLVDYGRGWWRGALSWWRGPNFAGCDSRVRGALAQKGARDSSAGVVLRL